MDTRVQITNNKDKSEWICVDSDSNQVIFTSADGIQDFVATIDVLSPAPAPAPAPSLNCSITMPANTGSFKCSGFTTLMITFTSHGNSIPLK